MRYPNAFKGVKKIWLAEILMLLAAALGIALIVIAALNGTFEGEQVTVSDSVAGISGVIAIVTALLMLVAFVLNLIGLISARKDEKAFGTALLVTLIGIVTSVISSVWSKNATLVKWMDLATTLCSLYASYFVLTGIANLAETFPDEATKSLALKSRNLLVGTFCATALFKCIITIFNIQEGSTANSILAVVALVLELVSYVVYLRALSKGKKMLAA